MRILPGLVAVATLGSTASPAAAAWREQRLPSPDATSIVSPPSIAADARGDTAVAWRARPRAFVAVRRAGAARFGRPIELRRFSNPRVAVLSDGMVLVASEQNDATAPGTRPCCRVVVVRRLRSGSRRLSAARVVTTRGVSVGAWSLAAGLGGHAALIADVDGLALSTSRGGGVFGALASPLTSAGAGEPFAGFGGDGRGLGLWVDGAFGSGERMMGAAIRRDASIGPARTFMTAPDPRSDDPFLDVRAGLDGRSRLTAAWIDGGHFFATPSTVNVATGTIFGLGRRQVLAQSANLPGGVRDPALSVARNGRAIVAWRSFGQGGERVSIAIRSRPGARFRVLTALAGDSYVPPVAMLASGYGVVVNRQRAIVVRPDDSLGASRRLLGAQSTDGVGVAAVGRRLTLVWGARNGLRSATFTP